MGDKEAVNSPRIHSRGVGLVSDICQTTQYCGPWSVTRIVNHEEGTIRVDTKIKPPHPGFGANLYRYYLKTKEDAVREGLIELGWTPPCE